MLDADKIIDKLYEDLNECPEEQQKEFVLKKFRQICQISDESDPTFMEFAQTKEKFSTYDNILKNTEEDLKELEYARLKMNALQQKNDSESESDDTQISYTIQQEDQLTELLDNLTTVSYEKNYKEAVQYYSILKDMLKSATYAPMLRKPGLRQTIEQCYKTLCELIIQDFESENPVFIQDDLIGQIQIQYDYLRYLIKLGHHQQLLNKYLALKSKNLVVNQLLNNYLKKLLEKYFNSTFGLDLDFLEKVCQEFLIYLQKVLEEVEEKLKIVFEENELLFSIVSNWLILQTKAFYQDISPSIFQCYDFVEILSTCKDVMNQFSDFEKNCISLTLPLQQYFAEDFENKLDELIQFYIQRSRQFLEFTKNKLYPIFLIKSLNFCDDELNDPELKSIDDPDYVKSQQMILPQEVKAKETTTLKSLFMDTHQPCTTALIYFWNVCFQLTESSIKLLNPDNLPEFYLRVFQSNQKKMNTMIKEFLKICRQSLANLVQPSQELVLFWVGNTYANFNFCNLLSQYINVKKPAFIVSNQQEWVQLVQIWYNEVKDVLQSYFNGVLIELIPIWFSDSGKVYCQKLEQTMKQATKPSTLFLMIALALSKIKQNLLFIIPRQALSYFILLLHEQIKYMIEYILYWQYHNVGKNAEVFFMEKKERDRMCLNLTQINLYLNQNAMKLSYFTEDGLIQFCYDIHFLSFFLFKYLGVEQSKQLNNDQFLNKSVALFNKEKNLKTDIKIQQSFYQEIIEKYIISSMDSDLIQFELFVKKHNKYSNFNFNFRQAIYDNQ